MTEKKVSAIGERALISRLSEIFKAPAGKGGKQEKGKEESPEGKKESPQELLVGPGSDDCAVLDLNGEDCLVVTTDMLHRTTDFPEGMTPWQIGWMSAAVNLSDIASMGARPTGLLVAIGMPADTEISFFEELAKGIQACAEFCETPVIGGDLDTHEELTITGTALGRVKKNQLLRRSGAKPGDLVCVTGHTGSAGAALEVLQSKHGGIGRKKASESLIKSLLEPVPRTHEAQKLAASGAVTSMMDTSDGLAMSLHDLAKVSRVGFKIRENSLPILQEVRDFASSPEKGPENGPEKLLELALYTGGDFELLFTITPERLKKVQNICKLSVIGECTKYEEGIVLESVDGRIQPVEQRGYQQLKAESS
ncbi:thiamine-phosphate kinase [Methanosarcina sp. KYL-1]|uniref:thiamine-phosphate kinase n=1 Tax=Methanosarcina sp. KYL-1 TaxID=2602068 RepID=UPI002101426B|nr:thiamine-phosphate kinase [Methanosarcina sp. KYL-1]MCQ1535996.1 thiamine-phosphate kinase [Methanosarcina sp. KYL-1]